MIIKPVRNMEEFAQLIGLSRPTVSKYFSDPESVKPNTRARIEKALRQHDYRPNLFAVNLNKKVPKIVGVIVPDLTDPFYAALVSRIELDCSAAGYLMIALTSHGDPRYEARAIDRLLSLKIAGVIVAPVGTQASESAFRGLQSRLPVVYLDSWIDEGVPFVSTDNSQSTMLITDYLCRTGDRPTLFELPLVNRTAEERRNAYLEAMDRAGCPPEIVTPGGAPHWRFEETGYAEASRVLAGGGFPTRTVLCANDRLAVGVMAAMHHLGLRIGREPGCDYRVAGHDDQPGSRYLHPPLTTVAQNCARLGSAAVDLLLTAIDGGETEHGDRQVRVEATLMMRASA